MKSGSTAMTQRPRDRVPSGSMLALPHTRRPDRANPPTNFWWSLFWQHWHDLHALGSHCTDSQQGILCWSLREFRKRFLGKRPALFKSAQWHFHQDNAPVHNSILVTDYLTKMGIKTVPHPPYSADLGPCDFWLLPKLTCCRWRWKRQWRRSLTRSHKGTSMESSRICWNGTTSALQPEEITSKGTRVSCVYSQ